MRRSAAAIDIDAANRDGARRGAKEITSDYAEGRSSRKPSEKAAVRNEATDWTVERAVRVRFMNCGPGFAAGALRHKRGIRRVFAMPVKRFVEPVSKDRENAKRDRKSATAGAKSFKNGKVLSRNRQSESRLRPTHAAAPGKKRTRFAPPPGTL